MFRFLTFAVAWERQSHTCKKENHLFIIDEWKWFHFNLKTQSLILIMIKVFRKESYDKFFPYCMLLTSDLRCFINCKLFKSKQLSHGNIFVSAESIVTLWHMLLFVNLTHNYCYFRLTNFFMIEHMKPLFLLKSCC